MAQKEIALMQVRMGKQRDLPDALEKGQIGFSTDVCRVFVGLPSSSEPASLVAGRTWTTDPNSGKENVELITEFSPWNVINEVVNQAYSVDVPANSTVIQQVQSTTRLFLDYVGYANDTGDSAVNVYGDTIGDNVDVVLESGSVQLVCKISADSNGDDEVSSILLSQQNNTNQSSGLICITFNDPSYNVNTKQMSISITNQTQSNDITVEFVVRGWDAV